MKILLSPLNWGLGHATRCIPLVRQFLEQGDEVVLAGDGDSLLLLQRHFPSLRTITFPSLELRYTENNQQRGFYLRALPRLLRYAIANRYYLHQQLAIEHFDLIVSDNRIGFFSRQVRSVYITHQLYLRLPRRLRLLQPIARALHACVYSRYNEVWVPDYADPEDNLAGELCHGGSFDKRVKYIGPLSRFSLPITYSAASHSAYGECPITTLALLSGLEPQRSIFERQLISRAMQSGERMILVQGLPSRPHTVIERGNITIVPHLSDEELFPLLQHAAVIIARSGYSTIMDLEVLGLLGKSELHPTPGQSEQEYLATLSQKNR